MTREKTTATDHDREPLLAERDRRKVLSDFNRTEAPPPAALCLTERFEDQARRNPQAEALICADGEGHSWRWTYQTLEARVNQLAATLRAMGAGPERRVGLCLRRRPGAIAALLGALKTGAAYVPMDPAYPEERLRYMIADARADLLITHRDLADIAPDGVRLLLLDDEGRAAAPLPAEPGPPAVSAAPDPMTLAYVIYTSGSTGQPKGVAIAHGAALALIDWAIDYFKADAELCTLASTSLSFDLSIFEIFLPLSSGGKIAMVENLLQLPSVPFAEEVDMVNTAPSVIDEFLEQDVLPGSVAIVNLAGEAFQQNLIVKIYKQGVREVHNLYGPSEDTTYSTGALMPNDAEARPTIGRPIVNTRCYALSGRGEPVALGAEGELSLGGAGLARGYLFRPDLTADRFTPDPFADTPGQRLYKTGDLVRYRPDGDLDFLGRADHQVKLLGLRIELGEIEAALCHDDRIEKALVMVREDRPGDKRLTAYLRPRDADETGEDEVRALLAQSLPNYMIPADFVFLSRFPTTPNGKIDRKALPAPNPTAKKRTTPLTPPRNACEERLVSIWSELMELPEIGVEDNFFRLGGHSLMAMRILARVRRELGTAPIMPRFFEKPTIAGLAELVSEQNAASGSEPSSGPLVERAGQDLWPLSFTQERLWFIVRLNPGVPIYAIPMAYDVDGVLDAPALERVLARLTDRHASLRTVFEERDGEPAQRIVARMDTPLTYADLRDAADLEATAAAIARADAWRPFDLTRGPLARFTVCRLAPQRWRLLVNMHHIITDGWSLEILLRELAALYREETLGEPARLPVLPLRYVDYAQWHRHWAEEEAFGPQLAYWTGKLAGDPRPLDSPFRTSRPKSQDFHGARLTAALSVSLTDRLYELAAELNASMFSLTLAAYLITLSRYAGQEDFLIAAPSANRDREELQNLVGFFVNTLLLRADLSGDPSFREAIERAHGATLEATANQDIPFERVFEALGQSHHGGSGPRVQTMFTFNEAGDYPLALPGADTVYRNTDYGIVPIDLHLTVTAIREKAGTWLDAHFNYAVHRLDRALVTHMAALWKTLLEAMARDSEAKLGVAASLTEPDRRILLASWNQSPRDWPRAGWVHERVAARAAAAPRATAVVDEGESITYGELLRRADWLADQLKRRGAGPGSLVASFAARSAAQVAGLLAIVKTGAAYLPIDPDTPPERIRAILEDAGARLVLTQAALLESSDALTGLAGEVLTLEAAAGKRRRRKAAGPEEPALSANHPAYAIYTSGSSGRPKGVLVSHGALLNLIDWHVDRYQVTPKDRASMLAGPAFDASVWEIWPHLAAGAQLRAAPESARVRPAELLAWFAENRITISFCPTPLAEALLAEPIPANLALRSLLTGGDRLLRRPSADFPAQLVNHYGPTEITVLATCGAVEPTGEDAPDIGRPIANVQAYVVDRRLHLAPLYAAGELLVGGQGVAIGYLGQPALTAERFAPDPFGPDPGRRLYKTGDWVRYAADGRLLFIGRIDFQVKIRGFRIELGEIEAVLSKAPDIQACVVLAREDSPGDKRLVAYAAAPEAGSDHRDRSAALSDFAAAHLPQHMIPQSYVFLARLPLNASGKVDRKALPTPDRTGGEFVFTPPASPTERALASLWSGLLGLDAAQIGRDYSFISLGGHSLLATRLVGQIRKRFRAELPLRDIFDRPRLRDQAWLIVRAARDAALAEPEEAIPTAPRTKPLPLSFAQQRLWFIEELEPGQSVYNIPTPFRALGPLSLLDLERALDHVVQRHESLRTVFAKVDGAPVQKILDRPFPTPALIDLSGLPPRDADSLAHALARADAANPFYMDQWPLFRCRLVRLGQTRHAFLFNFHHIIYDLVSTEVFMRELALAYRALALGEPQTWPKMTIQYADFAVWQRQRLTGERLERLIAFWRDLIGTYPRVLDLPVDKPRPNRLSGRGATLRFELAPELMNRLNRLSAAEGVSPFVVLRAAFGVLLARYSGQDRLLIGSPIANRTHTELEGLIGFFVNTLALPIDLSADQSFREQIRDAAQISLEAFDHQELPFERLVEDLEEERDLSRHQVIQAFFSLNKISPHGLELAGVRSEPIGLSPEIAHFDLSLALLDVVRYDDRGQAISEGAIGQLEYAVDLFEEATITRLARHYRRLATAIADDPDQSIHRFDLLAPEERQTILEQWGQCPQEPPSPLLTHQLTATIAARHPHGIAAVDDARALSYGALDKRANALAHRLRALGAGPDAIVAIYLPRCLETFTARLATFKAGAAFAPLDPTHPVERVRATLAEARPAALLTTPELGQALGDTGLAVLEPSADDPRADPPPDQTSGENLAYVIYTSGSTGKPKGVALPHAGLCNLIHWHRRVFPVNPQDRGVTLAGPAFDASIWEVWPYLVTGAAVHVLPEEARLDPRRFFAWLGQRRITALWAPPQITEGLMTLPADQAARLALRTTLTGADKVQSRPAPDSPISFFNCYGPTETSVISTWTEIRPGPADSPPPIGGPVDNLPNYLVDARLRPTPIGVPGELLIGGPGLARGYLGQPGLTAEKFIPDPFGGRSGDRLYRTGDKCRWLADGRIAFIGRIDFQVKLRGFRIELGEIEKALQRHSRVAASVVILREDRPGDKRLAAYITLAPTAGGPAPPADEDVESMRRWLAERLPDYMVPAAIVTLDAFPLNASGKIDRRALPQPKAAGGESGDGYLAPRNPLEERLAAIWAEALNRERVGVLDNFFNLGGHSLLATRVVSAVNNAFSLDLPIRALFTHPTIEAFARETMLRMMAGPAAGNAAPRATVQDSAPAQDQPSDDHAPEPQLAPVGRNRPLPLSFAQERMWFTVQMDPANPAYNMPFAFEADGLFDPGAFGEALEAVVRRHEPLRTLYLTHDGEPAQVVKPDAPPAFSVIDLSTAPFAEREPLALSLGRTAASRAFDLSRGPIVRCLYFKMTDRRGVILLGMHHIASDGWSMGVFFDEVSGYYAELVAGRRFEPPPLPIQYADYAVWQRQWLDSPAFTRSLDYWRTHLAGDLPELPVDRPRATAASPAGAMIARTLEPELVDRLTAFAADRSGSLFMALLAVYTASLRAYAGADLPIGAIIANRDRQELEPLIGFFVNTLVFHPRLADDPTLEALFARAQRAALDGFTHQDTPYDKLVESLRPARKPGLNPLFQAMFALQNLPGEALALPGARLAPMPEETPVAIYDLSLVAYPHEGGLTVRFIYKTDLFDADTIARFADAFHTAATLLATDCQRPLSAVVMPPRETRPAAPAAVPAAPDADEGDDPLSRTVPIGKPFESCRTYTLDRWLNLTPFGEPGELCIGGPGLARGYIGRPDLTALKFTPNPFVETPGDRLYRTGDRAVYLENGELDFLGRIDFQVKLRGFRIELGEIEELLDGHPGIQKAIAMVREDRPGDKRLVAYATRRGDAESGDSLAHDLRARCLARLPEYMVPAAIVLLDAFPLSPNGKIDRRALPAPDLAPAGEDVDPPRDSVERELAAIWEDLLDVRPIGIRANFFELGGHSLLSLRLMAQIQKRLGANLPVSALFQGPTIERLAELARRGAASAAFSPLVPIKPSGSKPPLFLVHAVGGDALGYLELAKAFGEDQPVYAFEAPGLDGVQEPETDLAALSERYIEAMRDRQPEGPWRLGGWSLGGVVAWEMTRRLRERGESVRLFLLDSYITICERAYEDAELALGFLSDLAAQSGRTFAPALNALDGARGGDAFRAALAQAREQTALPPDMDAGRLERLFRVYRANILAAAAYRPQPIRGKATLLRAADAAADYDPRPGWSAHGFEVAAVDVPGDHYTMLKPPHAATLAQTLTAMLTEP